jgi:iron complex outermembrane receptor protein
LPDDFHYETSGRSVATRNRAAQKRPENAQKVPITLTAFRAVDLERRNIQDVRDLASFTPGFNAAQFSYGKPIFAIRGAENTFSAAGATKPVGVFIDEVYIPRFSASNFSLFDAQSVTVLKGPQGTLFGRNVTAGAILVQTREPSLADVQASARVGIGNYDLREAGGYVSVPLSDTVAGSLTIDRQTRNGYGRDLLTRRDEDDANSLAGRAQLLFQPDAAFKLRLSADYSRDKNNGRALSALTNSDADRRTSELGIDQIFDRDIAGGSARMEFGGEPVKLTSITAYRYSNSFEIFSRSGLNFRSLTSGFQEVAEERERDKAFSQEGRLSYDDQTLNLITGLFYFKEKSLRGFRKYRLNARNGVTTQDNFYDQDVRTTSVAPFADATLHVTDRFDLTGGIRYTYEHKDAQETLTNKTALAASFGGTDFRSWSELTYRGVASFRPTNSLNLYGSYATGFTAGGYNTEANVIAAFRAPFDPEKSRAFEVGLKSRLLGGRAYFNLAAFSTKYSNKQEFVFNNLTFIGNIINAAKARAKGIESEIGFNPIQALSFKGTFAYLDGKYLRFDIPGAASATGNPLGNSPRVTYSLSADLRSCAPPAGLDAGNARHPPHRHRGRQRHLHPGAGWHHHSNRLWRHPRGAARLY